MFEYYEEISMKGIVLSYNESLKEGLISGNDGNRYSFFNTEWKESELPSRGQQVDFTVNALDQATSIYVIHSSNNFVNQSLEPDLTQNHEQLKQEENYGFFDWVMKCIKLENYVNFTGRARRAEYWYFQLFQLLISVVIGIIAGLSGIDKLSILANIISVALFLPSLAVYVRRLHDVNRSGWWILISFTIIGIIPLFIWLIRETDPKPNQWGSPAK